jgi:hypothetical protein
LRFLDLSGCHELSSAAFEAFGYQTLQYFSLPQTILKMDSSFQPKKLPEIKTRNLSTITSLNLSWCRGLTDIGLEYICTNCPKLQVLDIALCLRVTNQGLQNLRRCSDLKRLTLARCSQFTDEAFTFFQECKNLQMISLADVKISDKKIIELVTYCPHLQTLLLPGCRQLTDVALTSGIAPYARSLCALSLSGCVNMTETALIYLIRERGLTLMTLNIAETQTTDQVILVTAITSLSGSFYKTLG